MICCFLFSWRYNPLWLYFHSPAAGFGLLVFEVSWTHTKTRHSRWDSSGRVINPSQRPLPDNTQHSQQISMPSGVIRTHNLSGRAAVDLRLRPRGHWDRHLYDIFWWKYFSPDRLLTCSYQHLTYLYFYFFNRSETEGISTRQHLYWDGQPETGALFGRRSPSLSTVIVLISVFWLKLGSNSMWLNKGNQSYARCSNVLNLNNKVENIKIWHLSSF
jgi:hypothetical protein